MKTTAIVTAALTFSLAISLAQNNGTIEDADPIPYIWTWHVCLHQPGFYECIDCFSDASTPVPVDEFEYQACLTVYCPTEHCSVFTEDCPQCDPPPTPEPYCPPDVCTDDDKDDDEPDPGTMAVDYDCRDPKKWAPVCPPLGPDNPRKQKPPKVKPKDDEKKRKTSRRKGWR